MKRILLTILLLIVITEMNSKSSFEVTASYYNPTKSQCGSTPLITADGSKINMAKLKRGELRWVAVSRDLRSRFKYGDTIWIDSDDMRLRGKWVVRDTMNPKHRNRIDILTANKKYMTKPIRVKITNLKRKKNERTRSTFRPVNKK